jgi:hypothetical protein
MDLVLGLEEVVVFVKKGHTAPLASQEYQAG